MNQYRSKAAPGEWFHCYNRGIEKRIVFNDTKDYKRFQLLLLCANSSKSFMLSNIGRTDSSSLFRTTPPEVDQSLVEIGAYALMPNHFHIILKELADGGRAKFMQKLITGYTMYFNKRYQHDGPVFSGTYKSVHINSERQLRHVIAYVLLNPIDLELPKWKNNSNSNLKRIGQIACEYNYASGIDQLTDNSRPEGKILGISITEIFNKAPGVTELLNDAIQYYEAQKH